MSDKQPMTINGKALLEAELKNLLQVERPQVIKAIEEARDHGDLSENADYDAAKESRIAEIQTKLATAEVVDPKKVGSDRITFGATVTLTDLEEDREVTYQIVGEDEADVKQGKISIFSPLARALIGKRVDDVVEISTPKSDKEYEINNIDYK